MGCDREPVAGGGIVTESTVETIGWVCAGIGAAAIVFDHVVWCVARKGRR